MISSTVFTLGCVTLSVNSVLLRALAAPAADASPLPPSAKGKGAVFGFPACTKYLDGNLPIERLKSAESYQLDRLFE
jgi:hypothetical protein